jgi:Rrf2 family protein
MKFSTRARYALHIMMELARESLNGNRLVQLGHIARATGLSENYLAQLAMALKNQGLVRGVSGKKGGYRLTRPAEAITVCDVVTAAIGPISVVDCVADPAVCVNSPTCSPRCVWALVSHRVHETLSSFSLAELVGDGWVDDIRRRHPDVASLNVDFASLPDQPTPKGCPLSPRSISTD